MCTFRDPTRFEINYIINAVKYNIDKIKPSDHPKRDDEYGTSVISIQIKKDGRKISIKNRYNHTIKHFTDPEHPNPDNTFDSNPDNIIMGLSASLKEYFNVDWESSGVSLPDNFKLIDNKIAKVSFNDDNRHLFMGDDYWAQDGVIHPIDKSSQVVMDYMIWDSKKRQLTSPILPMEDGTTDKNETTRNVTPIANYR